MAYTGSKAKVGRGSIVSIGAQTGATGTEVFVVVGELNTASISGSSWGTAESTNFQSGVDEEFLTTTRNNGEVDIKGNLLDTDPGQQALVAAYNTGLKYDFKIQLQPGQGQTTGTLFTFSALVMSVFNIDISTKNIVSFDGKLKVSGPITPTWGS